MPLLPRLYGNHTVAGDMVCVFEPETYTVLLRLTELLVSYKSLYSQPQLQNNVNHRVVFDLVDSMPLVDLIAAIDRSTLQIEGVKTQVEGVKTVTDLGLNNAADSIDNIVAKLDDIRAAIELGGNPESLADNISEVVEKVQAIGTVLGAIAAVA